VLQGRLVVSGKSVSKVDFVDASVKKKPRLFIMPKPSSVNKLPKNAGPDDLS